MSDQEWYYSAEGHQLGPVPFAELQALVQNGTVRADDMVWTADFADWKPASAVPALWPTPDVVPYEGAIPPPPRVSPGPSGRPATTTSTMAAVSLALGVLSFVTCGCLLSIPGAICGHMALAQIKREPERLDGAQMALIGLALNYLNMVLIAFVTVGYIVAAFVIASRH